MFGDDGAMAGMWGYLEAQRQARLGTRISMWFDDGAGLQFNIHQPNMIGLFYEMNGELMFSETFIDWSGSGGSWVVGDIDAVNASKMLGAAAVFQVGSLGNYLDPHQQYSHLKFDVSRVDWIGVGLDATGIVADVVTAGVGGRAINGVQIAGVARVAGQTLDVADVFNGGAALVVDVHEGHEEIRMELAHMYFAISFILVAGGLANLAWSISLMRNPASLSPGSFMYRWIYMRWTLDSWKQDRDLENPRLEDRQIRNYAIGNAAVSILLIAIGVVLFLSADKNM